MKTYSELISFPTFEERFRYLQMNSRIGEDTFGFDRYLNQILYRSPEWRHLRNEIILRDDGCDLADRDRQIFGKIIIHHMNPITKQDVLDRSDLIFNPEYLICVSHNTHNAIHYGDETLLVTDPIIRRANDTCPWRLL